MKHWMLLLALLLLLLLPWNVQAQNRDSVYTISGFPLGVGIGVDASFWNPHAPYMYFLKAQLEADSLLRIQIRATADLVRFEKAHDPKNAATALSRYHAMVAYLVEIIGIPRYKILPALTDEPAGEGPKFRIVQIWTDRKPDLQTLLPPETQKPDDFEGEIAITSGGDASRKGTHCTDAIYGTLDAGATLTPFGKAAFLMRGSLGTSRLRFDAELGFSPLTNEWHVGPETYDANFTLMTGHVIYVPSDSSRWELAAGIERHEERSSDFGQHFRKRQGFVFGAGYWVSPDIAIRGYWGILEERRFDDRFAHWSYDQFRVALHLTLIGGTK